MAYFISDAAAQRYDHYRPQTHSIAVEWMKLFSGRTQFARALDIACGTGHSTTPLLSVADQVVGIDISEPMLAVAREKGLAVENSSIEEYNSDMQYDLITTSMAFHWFDPDAAIPKYKALSQDKALWLMYTFGFSGHRTSQAFNTWSKETYPVQFPTPPRGKQTGVMPQDDPQIVHLHTAQGHLSLEFDLDALVGYLTTQSNVEHAVQQGQSYEEVEARLKEQISQFDLTGNYKYYYSFELYRYIP